MSEMRKIIDTFAVSKFGIFIKQNKIMGKGKFWSDFKDFAVKGNVVDMAVGVVVGGAFGKIVTSLVSDIIMPLVGMLLGGMDFTSLKVTLPNWRGVPAEQVATLNYGNFIQQTIDFCIIAFCIFLVIRLIMKFKKEKPVEPVVEEAPAKPEDVVLLEEIRDLLKKQ